MTCFFVDSFESRMNPRFLAESEKGMRAKSNRVREGNGRRFQGRRKGKEKSFCWHWCSELCLCEEWPLFLIPLDLNSPFVYLIQIIWLFVWFKPYSCLLDWDSTVVLLVLFGWWVGWLLLLSVFVFFLFFIQILLLFVWFKQYSCLLGWDSMFFASLK